jgi:outer membrane protein, heavy metal efflux system
LLTRKGLWSLVLTAGMAFAQVPERLTLEEAVATAVASHPTVRAAAAVVAGSEGAITQSRLRPNPSLTFQAENWRFYGDPSFDTGDDLEVVAFLTQPILRGDKRELRVALAEQGRALAELARDETVFSLRLDVKERFWLALLEAAQLRLVDENVELVRRLVEYHRRRVEAGAMAEADLIRVQLEEDRIRLDHRQVALQASQALRELTRTMGVEPQERLYELVPPSQASLPARGMPARDLRELALEERFEVRRARAFLEQARRRQRLEEAQASLDWDLIFGYKRTDGFNTVLGGLNIPLPWFDSNQGNIAASRSEVSRAEFELTNVLRRVGSEVGQQLDALRRQKEMVEEIRSSMLPRAEESWQIADAAYREDGLDLLRLLDAQRSHNEVRLLLNRAELEFEISLVRLERVVGREGLPVGEETLRED